MRVDFLNFIFVCLYKLVKRKETKALLVNENTNKMLIKYDCKFEAEAAQWNKAHCEVKDLRKDI